jgi:hypothetical protein
MFLMRSDKGSSKIDGCLSSIGSTVSAPFSMRYIVVPHSAMVFPVRYRDSIASTLTEQEQAV